MSFPKYEAYKDSGVEWLGKVPEHWILVPLKWLSELITTKATHSSWQIGLENVESWSGQFIETESEFSGSGLAFIPEDILFGKLRPYLAKAYLAERYGEAVGDFFVLRPKKVLAQYLHKYILSPSVIDTLNASTIGAKMPRVSWEDMGGLPIALPSVNEQKQIARFLDHETDRIDTLIAEQQRLIELLKEKRQAVISHAVTKGLDPTVPMKDSGVEWIGEIPTHWKMMMVKHTARSIYKSFTDGDWIESPYITTEGVRLIQTGNVGIGTYKEKGFRYISERTFKDLKCTEIFPNDVLVCRLDGPVGRACLVPNLDSRMITSVDNAILKLSKDFDPRFIVYTMSSNLWLEWIQAICRVGGGFRFRISRLQLGDLTIPAPPVEEQRTIADLLDAQFLKIDRLEGEIEQSIATLQERRAALISAAVTGKIDVRGWKAPANASPAYC